MKRFINLFIMISILSFSNIDVYALDCNKILRKGNTGEDVYELQQKLNEKASCNLEVDSIFGINTYNCVRKYQALNNLETDGIVGINTCNSINTNIKTSTSNKGIVTGKVVNVRENSSIKSKVIKTVNTFTEVEILGEENNWYKTNIGYINKRYLKNTFILIDISDEYLYYYKNGSIVFSSPVITGNKDNHDTPIGSYKLKVKNKKRDVTLKGKNDDGSNYSSFVNYWMPFTKDLSIGMHDASWRDSSEFTNTRYIGYGSHGCINLKHDDALYLYDNIVEDTNVLVRE